MKTFNHFYQEFLFRGLDLLRGRDNINKLKFLRKSQYWERNQLHEWQLARLNNLLSVAKCHSKFYEISFRNVKLPLASLNEIQHLPIVTKQDMRSEINNILCDNVHLNQLEKSRTGGSTGEPSFYYLDKNSKDWNRGSVYRSAEWANSFLGDKTVLMTGSHFDYKEFQKIKCKVIFFLQRYKDLSVAVANDETFDDYYNQIQSYKPTSIWGYASGIYLFATFLKKTYPMANFDFLQSIITSSETLMPGWREEINQVFGGNKVFNHYGSREMYIGSECKEHRGYHLHGETVILEIVDHENHHVEAGEMGRILVTDLSNLSFPFIRYEIGDVGALSPEKYCSCGIKLPILEMLEGRIADIIVLKNRKLTPPNFATLMSDLEGIEQYQIIQKYIDSLDVLLKINEKFDNALHQYIENSIKTLAGPDVQVNVKTVSDIPTPESGKRRYIISEVSRDYI